MIVEKSINFIYLEKNTNSIKDKKSINLKEISSFESLINLVYKLFNLTRNDNLFYLNLHYIDNYGDISANINSYENFLELININKDENLHIIHVYYYPKEIDDFSLNESRKLDFDMSIVNSTVQDSFFLDINKENSLYNSQQIRNTGSSSMGGGGGVGSVKTNYILKEELNDTQIMPESKEYFNKVFKHLLCPICNGLYIDPVSCTLCENVYCRKCIQTFIDNNKPCPLDECFPVQIKDEIEKSTKNKLDKIKVKCLYNCNTNLTLYEYGSHLIKCEVENKKILCWLCNKGKLKRKDQIISKEEIEQLREKVTLLENESKIDKQKNLILEQKLIDKNINNNDFNDNNAKCKNCEKLQGDINNLINLISTAESKINDVKYSFSSKLDSNELKLNEVKKENADLQLEISKLKDIQVSKINESEYTKKLELNELEINKVKKEKDKQQEEISRLESLKLNYESQLSNLKFEYQKLREDNKRNDNDLTTTKLENEMLFKDTIHKVKFDYEDAIAELKFQKDSEIKNLQSELANKQKELSNYENQNKKGGFLLNPLKNVINSFKPQTPDLKVEELEKLSKDLLSEQDSLNIKINKLEKQLLDEKNNHAKLLNELDNKNLIIFTLQSQQSSFSQTNMGNNQLTNQFNNQFQNQISNQFNQSSSIGSSCNYPMTKSKEPFNLLPDSSGYNKAFQSSNSYDSNNSLSKSISNISNTPTYDYKCKNWNHKLVFKGNELTRHHHAKCNYCNNNIFTDKNCTIRWSCSVCKDTFYCQKCFKFKLELVCPLNHQIVKKKFDIIFKFICDICNNCKESDTQYIDEACQITFCTDCIKNK